MTQRTFIPGSEWLYFKIYTGHKTADEILVQALRPLVRELLATKLIDNFFFIRYVDPEFHIRFRLHIPSVAGYGPVFAQFYERLQPCLETGLVSRVMCDTYQREIERYGENTMGLLETVFQIDSMAVMELLARVSALPGDTKEDIRWRLSLILLDDTLSAFSYDLPDKLRITDKLSENYKKEFGFTNHAYTKQLNDKYRAVRANVERDLSTRELFTDYEGLLQARREQTAAIAGKIKAINATVSPVQTTDDLIYSIQHMTMNRWFRARNRQHELVIYDFLRRYYDSSQMKQRHHIKSEESENL